MNSKLIISLLLACLVLILLITAEWFYAKKVRIKLLSPANITVKKLPLDEMPSINLLKQSEENYVDLVTRPLFIKGRRPVDEPSPEAVQAGVNASSFDWQLNGVYTTKKGLYALVSRDKKKLPKDNYRKITVKENVDLKNHPTVKNELDGWNLTKILKDRIILKQGTSQKELMLKKDKPKNAPTDINGLMPPAPGAQQAPGFQPPGMQPPGMQPPDMQPPGMIPPNTMPGEIPTPMPEPTEENIENNNNVHL